MPPQMNGGSFRNALQAQATMVGRFSGPEFFFGQDVNLATPNTIQLPRPLNINRPLLWIQLLLQGRLTVTVAPYTTVGVEGFENLLQQVQLQGIHRAYGSLTPIRASGSTLFAHPLMMQSGGNLQIINGVMAPDPGYPAVSPFAGSVNTYDFQVIWNLPLVPSLGMGMSVKKQINQFSYLSGDWGDTLFLQLSFGDATALGNTTGATTAFTAFQSASGSPSFQVHLGYSLLGDFARGLPAGVVIRNEQSLSGFTAAQNNVRLSLLQKNITPLILTKTGSRLTTGVTGQVTTFASLSDEILDRTQVVVDNKPVKNNFRNIVTKGYLSPLAGSKIPQGYFPSTFTEAQSALVSYRGDGLSGGSTYELDSDVLTTDTNQLILMTQEQIVGGPFPALR